MKNEAIEVIKSNPFAVLATLNEDGSPHATPVGVSFDGTAFFWKSAPEAQHSRNIDRDPRVALSIIEKSAEANPRAVYISTRAEATGKHAVDPKWNKNVAEYRADLTEVDEAKTEPGRYYFKEQAQGETA